MTGTVTGIGKPATTEVIADRSESGEYLTFRLAAEEYALEILKVQEIRNYETATAIANAPAFVNGVINLRGVIVPIFDLRVMLGLGRAEYTPFTVVIVLNLSNATVGLVVDSVSDVVALAAGQIRPAPDFSGTTDTCYVKGLGTLEGRTLIVADIESLLGRAGALPAGRLH